jgi:hypothetical protein
MSSHTSVRKGSNAKSAPGIRFLSGKRVTGDAIGVSNCNRIVSNLARKEVIDT